MVRSMGVNREARRLVTTAKGRLIAKKSAEAALLRFENVVREMGLWRRVVMSCRIIFLKRVWPKNESF